MSVYYEPKPFTQSLIIFEHPVARYAYSPALDIYRIADSRFNDIALYADLKAFMAVFNENFEKALEAQKRIITAGYTPLMARVVNVMLDKYFSDCRDNWQGLSFFHNDADTAAISLAEGENPLTYKMELLTEMLDYPYIKTLEIPRNAVITGDLLAGYLA